MVIKFDWRHMRGPDVQPFGDAAIGQMTVLPTESDCDYIARGGKECHLLWGNLEYKSRFHGVPRNRDHLVVYRVLTAVLLNVDFASKSALAGMLRQTRQWLLAHRERPLLQLVVGVPSNAGAL